MNRKRILTAAANLVLAGLLFYFYGAHQAPSGQASLANLTSETLPGIKDADNAAKRDVRGRLILSSK